MGRWSGQEFTARFREALASITAATLAARLRDVLGVNLSGISGEVRVPVIYLQASEDRLVPARAATAFDVPLDAVIRVEGPHFLLQANPEASAAHILDFVAQVQ